MKTIRATFHKDGYEHELINRIEDVAVYRKSKGSVVSFEVMVVLHHEAYSIGGRDIEAGEHLPGSEMWGTLGWTFRGSDEATAWAWKLAGEQRAKKEGTAQ